MTLIVATMNFGMYLTPNVRASHAHAAERWGAERLVIERPWSRSCDVFGAKLEINEYPWPPGARVALIDGDAIVRADCPSPFEMVPEGAWGAVANLQDGMDAAAVERCQFKWWIARGGQASAYRSQDYFNGGVLVFEPGVHDQVWTQARRIAGRSPVNGIVEQSAINIAAARLATRALLPPVFNRLGPAAWMTEGPMLAYVYHLARYLEYRGRARQRGRLERIDWRDTGPTVPHVPPRLVPPIGSGVV